MTGPLSFQQQEMVRRLRDAPECAPFYDLLCVFELRGPLDSGSLAGALEDVQVRHGALRTTLATSGGELLQHMHAGPATETVRGTANGCGASELVAPWLAARHTTDAVLAGHPLFRAQLVALGDDHHLLALTIHHLVYDGLSLTILWRDLAELYAARVQRRPPDLPKLSLSYLEYALAQQADWPSLARTAVPFWRDVTEGAPLQTTWPQPAGPGSYEVTVAPFALGPSAMTAVRGLARRARATPFLAALAATGAALARVTGQGDVVLGTDFANREAAFKHEMIGHLLNTRLTRWSSAPGVALGELVFQARESWLAADEHRDAYMDRVLDALGGLFPIAVVVEPPDLFGGPSLPGIGVRPVPFVDHLRYWRELMVTWRSTPQDLTFDITYRPSCVAPACVAAVGAEIRAILEYARDDG